MNKFVLGAALTVALASPVVAQDVTEADSRAGVRIEARAIYETPTVSSVAEDDDVYKVGSAVAFGAEAGVDFAVGDKVVVGPYAFYDKSTVENCEGTTCVGVDGTWGVGAHLGYTVGDKGMVFLKLGYASMTVEAEVDGFKNDENSSGFGGAIGYEHAFTQNVYGRAFLGYEDHGDIAGINFQRRHAGVSVGARF